MLKTSAPAVRYAAATAASGAYVNPCQGRGLGGMLTAIIGPLTASFTASAKGTQRLSITGRPAAIAARFMLSQS
jgi:hypothetical protein